MSLTQQLAQLQQENHTLRVQIRQLEKEIEQLKTQTKSQTSSFWSKMTRKTKTTP